MENILSHQLLNTSSRHLLTSLVVVILWSANIGNPWHSNFFWTGQLKKLHRQKNDTCLSRLFRFQPLAQDQMTRLEICWTAGQSWKEYPWLPRGENTRNLINSKCKCRNRWLRIEVSYSSYLWHQTMNLLHSYLCTITSDFGKLRFFLEKQHIKNHI